MVSQDCSGCDGRGKVGGKTCARCGGSCEEPPTREEIVQMRQFAERVLRPDVPAAVARLRFGVIEGNKETK